MYRIVLQVKNTLEVFAHANRPGNRCAANPEYIFDFIHQIDWVATFAVQFIDEGDDRRIAQSTNVHELNGTFFDTLGAVDDH